MAKGKKRARGTTMKEVIVEMSNMSKEGNFTETSVLLIQPQNPLIPETQARFQAHSRTYSQHKSQPLSKSLPQTQHQAGPASKLSKEKKGRGPAKLADQWGSDIPIEVTLDEEGDVVGVKEEYNKYSSSLGALARIGTLLPLHYTSWSYMPKEKLDGIWEDVKANTTLPIEARSIVLHTLNNMWRDWKLRLKTDYFVPHMNDPNHDFSQLPNELVELDQWLILVQYWKSQQVKEQAIQNAKNRAKKKYLHRTGKTPFPLLKQEMRHEGKDTTKFDIFVCSRSGGQGIHADGETSTLVHGLNEALSKRPESERTKEFKEDLLINAIGEDQHGRRFTRSKLRKSSSINVQTTQFAGQIEELRRLKDEVTHEKNGVEQIKMELIKQKEDFAKEKEQVVDEVRKEFKDQLEHMKVSMEFFMSFIDPAALQSAMSRVTAQVIDSQMNSQRLHPSSQTQHSQNSDNVKRQKGKNVESTEKANSDPKNY
ncbi:hypothetical protein BUALT_BualtUnG0055600 [Buddleja alternifolia]|uniref:Uncharacterized protein n=1 Tax=Buddleja alternifolia TaxID=168488 RepID=A0AAV6W4L8_9LAMI|nr:hypothetical protein BUALT_BualtUnG0055600 [Buddleja alternifolia]